MPFCLGITGSVAMVQKIRINSYAILRWFADRSLEGAGTNSGVYLAKEKARNQAGPGLGTVKTNGNYAQQTVANWNFRGRGENCHHQTRCMDVMLHLGRNGGAKGVPPPVACAKKNHAGGTPPGLRAPHSSMPEQQVKS